MDTASFSELRQNLATVWNRVESGPDQVVLTRKGHEPLVLMTLAEWNSITETEYLLSNPRTAARLAESATQLDEGQVKTVTLEELQATVEDEAA